MAVAWIHAFGHMILLHAISVLAISVAHAMEREQTKRV